jgi:hypothetical protein
MSHAELFRSDVLGALIRACKKTTKCGCWVKFPRVLLADVVDICPALDNAANERKSSVGAVIREAGFDFTAFRLFHQWIDNGFGVCSVDARGDAWFIIGAALRHVDPGATRITPPFVFLTVEVILLFVFRMKQARTSICFVISSATYTLTHHHHVLHTVIYSPYRPAASAWTEIFA